MALVTEAKGIFQADVLLRTAIIEAIRDIQSQPWLINYVFQTLVEDDLTNTVYGAKEVEQAKKWLSSTNFPVFMSYRNDEIKLPAISIALMESSEAEQTHGDIHYIPEESKDAVWPTVLGPLKGSKYDPNTGAITFPTNTNIDDVNVGMVVIDRQNRQFPIVNLGDGQVFIEMDALGDFNKVWVKDPNGGEAVTIESIFFRETYQIGCHVQSEAFYLTYLHSLLVFILAGRYKQALLEARGFERSTLASSQFTKNTTLGVENAYSRYINITGYVKQAWPKFFGPKISGPPEMLLTFGKEGTSGPGINDQGKAQTADDPWGVDEDALSSIAK